MKKSTRALITEIPSELEFQIAEAKALLSNFFKSETKAEAWLNIENPMLGNSSPIVLFKRGRGHKVLSFIKNAINENTCSFTDKILKGEKV